MVWGKPEDMPKHPDGEEHIQLWDLPRLTAMVTRVKAKLEAILGKRLQVMTQCTCGSLVAKWKCEVGAHLGLNCALRCLCARLVCFLHAR